MQGCGVPQGFFHRSAFFVNGGTPGFLAALSQFQFFCPEADFHNGLCSKLDQQGTRRQNGADPVWWIYSFPLHGNMWGGMHYAITGKDEKGNLKYERWLAEQPCLTDARANIVVVENIFERT